jgi:hypothetical protein
MAQPVSHWITIRVWASSQLRYVKDTQPACFIISYIVALDHYIRSRYTDDELWSAMCDIPEHLEKHRMVLQHIIDMPLLEYKDEDEPIAIPI